MKRISHFTALGVLLGFGYCGAALASDGGAGSAGKSAGAANEAVAEAGWLLSDRMVQMIGRTVVSGQGTALGKVEDLVQGDDGERHVVIDLAGSATPPEKLLVPLDELAVRDGQVAWVSSRAEGDLQGVQSIDGQRYRSLAKQRAASASDARSGAGIPSCWLNFTKVDGNLDGQISEQEAQAHRRAVFRGMDANSDGAISREEYQRCLGGSEVARVTAEVLPGDVQRFARMDRNGDGRVSRDEYLGLAEQAYQGRAQGGQTTGARAADWDDDGHISPSEAAAESARRFAMLDVDGDGGLSRMEWSTSHSEHPLRLDASFAALDRNGDGKIDAAEVEQRLGDEYRRQATRGQPVTAWRYTALTLMPSALADGPTSTASAVTQEKTQGAAAGAEARSGRQGEAEGDQPMRLGVVLQPLQENLARVLKLDGRRGALVADVQPDSAAAQAGLRPGDVIVQLGGRQVSGPRDLARAIRQASGGEPTDLTVIRDGERQQLQATLQPVLPDLQARVERAPLGLTLAPLSDDLRRHMNLQGVDEGAVIIEVAPGSAAAQAGLRPGGVILQVGEQQISGPDEVAEQVRRSRGETILFRVNRDGRHSFVAVDRPTQAGQRQQAAPERDSARREQLSRVLAEAGFTDVTIVDAAYLVQAKTSDGTPVLMLVNPHSAAAGGLAAGASQREPARR